MSDQDHFFLEKQSKNFAKDKYKSYNERLYKFPF